MSLNGAGPDPRRLGTRLKIGDLEGRISLMMGGRWRRRVEKIPVALEDASVSGIGFRVAAPLELARGQVLAFELNGVESEIRIRWQAAGGRYFGAEFVHPEPDALTEIHRLLHGDADAENDRLWEESKMRW